MSNITRVVENKLGSSSIVEVCEGIELLFASLVDNKCKLAN